MPFGASSILGPPEILTLKHAQEVSSRVKREAYRSRLVVITTWSQLTLPRLSYNFCIGFNELKLKWIPNALRNHQPMPNSG